MSTLHEHLIAWYLRVTNALSSFDDESGQGLVEYALIIAVVGVMLAGALVALRGGIQGTFNQIQGNLQQGG